MPKTIRDVLWQRYFSQRNLQQCQTQRRRQTRSANRPLVSQYFNAVVVEVKYTLRHKNIDEHIERIEKLQIFHQP